jgi:hypothetical protein
MLLGIVSTTVTSALTRRPDFSQTFWLGRNVADRRLCYDTPLHSQTFQSRFLWRQMGSTYIHNGTSACTIEAPDMREIGFLAVLSMDRAEADMENRGRTGGVSDSPAYSTTVVQGSTSRYPADRPAVLICSSSPSAPITRI